MTKLLMVLSLVGLPVSALADANSVHWPERGTKVICGADADGRALAMREVMADELLAAESDDGRVLIYFDLKKPGRVHWVFSEALTDDQYNRREAALAKLAPADAELLRSLTASRQTELYMGMTDGFVTYRTDSKGRSLSMSCQEVSQ